MQALAASKKEFSMQGEKWLSGTELKGKIVTLIPLQLEHASALVEAASDGELWDLWYTKIPNKETVSGYIELALSEQDAGRSLAFSVIDNETQNAQDQASQTTTVKAQIGGVAFPEMAMGKVLLPYVPANKAEAIVETPVVEHVIAEAPVATTQAEAPVINEVPAIAEAPVAEQKVEVTEAPVTPAEVAVAETSAPTTTVVAEKPQYKGHASSGMTKATGPTEIKEITVTAAAFRTERFEPKQAGSQTATSQASAAMAKTAGL